MMMMSMPTTTPASPSPINNATASTASTPSSSSSSNQTPEPRSQAEIQHHFVSILRDEALIYRKSQTAYIRPAKKGETIETVINGVTETSNECQDDQSWVVQGKVAGEHYLLTKDNFDASYIKASAKQIMETTSLTSCSSNKTTTTTTKGNVGVVDAKTLREDGFQEYQSKRSVYAHVVTANDMAWLLKKKNKTCQEDDVELCKNQTQPDGNNNNDNGDKDKSESAYFMAPWGEPMVCQLGDLLVMQYTEDDKGENVANEEIYRIEKTVFSETYRKVCL